MRAGWRSWTKGLISAIYSSEKVRFSFRWGRARVSFNGLLWWNIWNISPLFGLRDPLKAKPASSNRLVSVERLSVAKRLLLWQISGSWGSAKTAVLSRRFQAFGGAVCEREPLRRAMGGIILNCQAQEAYPRWK